MKPFHITAVVPALALATSFAMGAASAQFVDVAAGEGYSLALQADGQVLAWGSDSFLPAPPPGLTYVEVAAGGSLGYGGIVTRDFLLARRSDGSVVDFGGLGPVPALPPGLSYTSIAAGEAHALALRSDGSVVAWGDNSTGACDVPALPPGLTYVEIAAGGQWFDTWDFCFGDPLFGIYSYSSLGFSVARRSDGSLVAWGYNSDGQCDVPALPPGLTYVEVSAGSDHAAARRNDGSVVAWGGNDYGQSDVPAPPPGLSYAGLDASAGNTTAWLSDGSLVEWGLALAGIPAPPLPPGISYVDLQVSGALGDFLYIAQNCSQQLGTFGGPSHVVALRSDGSVVAWGDNTQFQVYDPWTDLGGGTAGAAGTPVLTGYGTPLEGEGIAVNLSDVLPGEALLAWISFTPVPFQALGGTVHAYPFSSQLLATAGAFGTYNGSAFWPAGIPSGTEVWFQFLVQDGTVPAGITLSNGLKLEAP